MNEFLRELPNDFQIIRTEFHFLLLVSWLKRAPNRPFTTRSTPRLTTRWCRWSIWVLYRQVSGGFFLSLSGGKHNIILTVIVLLPLYAANYVELDLQGPKYRPKITKVDPVRVVWIKVQFCLNPLHFNMVGGKTYNAYKLMGLNQRDENCMTTPTCEIACALKHLGLT